MMLLVLLNGTINLWSPSLDFGRQASDLSQKVELDWCAGTKQLWEVNGPNPCEVLATGFERLSGGFSWGWRS
jgi:hypothetical protein